MTRITELQPSLNKQHIEEDDEHEIHPPTKPILTKRLMLTVFIVALSSHFHFGYQLGVPNTAGKPLKKFFNDSFERQLGAAASSNIQTWVWAVYVGTFQLLAVVGSQITHHTIDKIGRRSVFLLFAIIATLSGILGFIAYFLDLPELLFVSRVGYGLVLGGGMAATSIYLTEVTPTNFRGGVNVFGSVMFRAMTIVGYILGSPQILGTSTRWPYLFMFELIVSTIHLLGVIFIVKESPTYLMRTGRRDEAAKIIQQYHGAKANFVDVMELIDEEIALNTGSLSLVEVLRSSTLRRGALLGIVGAIAQSVTGPPIICSFSSHFLMSNGLGAVWASWATIAMGVSGLLSVIGLVFAVERFGRRPMMLISLVVIISANLSMLAVEFVYPHFVNRTWLYIIHAIALSVYLFAFSIGVGPISWFLASEMVPVNARAATQSFASSLAFFFLGTGPMYFLPLYDSVRGWAYLTLIIPPFICFLILAKWLPETKQKSIMEIMAILNNIQDVDEDLEKKTKRADNRDIELDDITTKMK